MRDPYKDENHLLVGAGCVVLLYVLGFVAFWVTVGFVVLHFIAKVW